MSTSIPSSINKNVVVDRAHRRRLRQVLEDMVAWIWRDRAKSRQDRLKAWWKQIEAGAARNCLAYKNTNVIKPQYAIERLYALTKDRDTYITTEVGQHQMWAAQFSVSSSPTAG
jgi:acetolactate synthase-1/2/3 large subunit